MKLSLECPLNAWADNHPQTVAAISRIHEAGGRVALTSSLPALFAAEVGGLNVRRMPEDTDLLIHSEDLVLAAEVLGVGIQRDELKRVKSSDGQAFVFTADEVIAHLDSDIQLLCPQGPLRSGGHTYNTGFSNLAAWARDVYETNHGLVPVAPTDARFMYGIFQRDHRKHDAHNAGLLAIAAHPATDAYSIFRAEEMHLDSRVWNFLGDAGVSTAVRTPLLAV